MKTFVVMLALLLPLNSMAFERDKAQHFAVSCLLYQAVYLQTGNKGVAVISTIVAGYLKELADPTFSNGDMLANAAGIGLGVAFTWRFK